MKAFIADLEGRNRTDSKEQLLASLLTRGSERELTLFEACHILCDEPLVSMSPELHVVTVHCSGVRLISKVRLQAGHEQDNICQANDYDEYCGSHGGLSFIEWLQRRYAQAPGRQLILKFQPQYRLFGRYRNRARYAFYMLLRYTRPSTSEPLEPMVYEEDSAVKYVEDWHTLLHDSTWDDTGLQRRVQEHEEQHALAHSKYMEERVKRYQRRVHQGRKRVRDPGYDVLVSSESDEEPESFTVITGPDCSDDTADSLRATFDSMVRTRYRVSPAAFDDKEDNVMRPLPCRPFSTENELIEYLTPEQCRVYYAIRSAVGSSEPRRMLVHGGPGCGKTTTILFSMRQLAVPFLAMAHYGSSASNIAGETIFSFLGLTRIDKSAVQNTVISDDVVDSLRQRLRDIKFIYIDEVSTMSADLLEKVNSTLQTALNNSDPFGGLSVVLSGDFGQLKPIGDASLIESRPAVWRTITDTFSLNVNKRIDDPQINEFLERLRRGSLLVNVDDYGYPERDVDWQFLQTLMIDYQQMVDNIVSDEGFVLVDSNAMRHTLNFAHLDGRHVHALHALESTTQLSHGHGRLVADPLPKTVYVFEGCRVMLTRNLDPRKGLCNGALGRVRSVVYHTGRPLCVVVEFTTFTCPVFRVQESCSKRLSRSQFPLEVAKVLTIDKSLGLTLPEHITVHLGARERREGLAVVALSRMTRREDLSIVRCRRQRFANIKRCDAVKYFYDKIDRTPLY